MADLVGVSFLPPAGADGQLVDAAGFIAEELADDALQSSERTTDQRIK